MPLARILRDHAVTLSASLKRDLADLAVERQLLNGNPKTKDNLTRLRKLDSQMRQAEAGIARLIDYNPETQRPFDCPYCWIIEARRFRLEAAEGRVAAVSCPNCTAEFSLD